MIRRFRAAQLAGTSLFLTGWLFAATAYAQTSTAQDGLISTAAAEDSQDAPAPDGGGEIVVTGSRVISNGNAQPTPVTVVSSEGLSVAAPKGIAEALLQVPSFTGSNSRSAGGAAANAGHTYLNLRGLGTARNLVLLDGRRFVSTSDGGAADINLFPQLLLRRVEIVTGGASAAYGSDAVAGVTNFILDTRLRGVKGMFSRGVTRYGDGETLRASLAAGASFAGDRGHIVGSFDFTDGDGVAGFAVGGPIRPWQRASRFLITNPAVTAANRASPSNPTLIVGNDVRLSNASYGGLITAGPLAGTQFLPGGVSAPFRYGANRGAGFMEGGDGATSAGGGNLETPINSKIGFLHADFEITPTFTVYAEATYARTNVYNYNGPTYAFNATAYTIYNDNAYLPANIRTLMAAPGNGQAAITSFTLSRWNLDFGAYRKHVLTETNRQVIGANGKIGEGWAWDIYYQRGRNKGTFEGLNGQINANLYNAVDAVVNPANGQIVCRTTLTNPINGCVPINLFGQGSPTAAALDYIRGTPTAIQNVEQDVVAGNLRGTLFQTWAGDVNVAIGAEHRREGLRQVVDALSVQTVTDPGVRGFPRSLIGTQGAYFLGSSNQVDGSYTVNEVFAEAVVPLARDVPFAKSLELNAAGRLTRYSNVGEATTWKVGLSYAPADLVRFRATASRDIRAPNVGELYLAQAQTIATVLDPFNNNAAAAVTIQLPGNPGLRPERAQTYAVGAVLTPGFAPNFSASVDYYQIKIKDAIGRLTNQQTVDQCFKGNASLCALISRLPSGAINILQTPNLNLAELKTRGVDFEINYSVGLGTLPVAGEGRLTLRGLGTYVAENSTTTQGSAPIDRARSTPFQMTWSANLDTTHFGLFVQERLIGARAIDVTYGPSNLAYNRIPPVWYTDLTLTYKLPGVGKGAQAFLTANNLFDHDPPTAVVTATVQGTPTINSTYDLLGRYVTAGVRIAF